MSNGATRFWSTRSGLMHLRSNNGFGVVRRPTTYLLLRIFGASIVPPNSRCFPSFEKHKVTHARLPQAANGCFVASTLIS
jgi:hypothetical protein